MASTEEVLKALQNAKITTLAATEPEELVIDAETRTITVPSSERLFGVTGDMNIERKYFRCPKIVGDNVDLSTHQIFIAYVYTETESGSIFPSIGVAPYHCEDVEVDGEDITFSWKLTGNVFKNPGFILFKMYAKRTEADPNTVFNTTPAIGTVLATIPDGTEEIKEEYPDVIAQIFDRLDALESGGGTGGTTNYENLSNKPQLNGVTLEGNKTLDQVGVLAKNQGSNNSGKYLSVGSDGNVVPADAPSGGTVDPEQIKQAVNGYLEENPPSGMTSEQKEQLGKVWIENNPSYTIAENKSQIFDIVENGKADKVTITDGSDYWDGEPEVSYPGTLSVKTLRGNRFYANMWLPNGMDMDQSYRYAADKNGQIRLYDILNQKLDLTGLSPWGICLKGEGKSFPTGECHFIISKIRVLGLDSSSGKWKLVKTCKPIAALFDIAQTSSEGTFVDVDRTVLSDDMFMFSIRQPTSWTMNGDMCFHFYPENTDAVTKEDVQDCSRILIAFRIRVQEAENSEIFTCSCGCDALGGTGVEAFFSRFNAVTDTLQELNSNNCLESESNILTDNLEAINELIYKEESVVSDEQVKGAVDSYFEENPVSGMTAEQEQQLNQNTQDVGDLKSAKVDKTGWSPNKYIGTDAFGNIVEKDAPNPNAEIAQAEGSNLTLQDCINGSPESFKVTGITVTEENKTEVAQQENFDVIVNGNHTTFDPTLYALVKEGVTYADEADLIGKNINKKIRKLIFTGEEDFTYSQYYCDMYTIPDSADYHNGESMYDTLCGALCTHFKLMNYGSINPANTYINGYFGLNDSGNSINFGYTKDGENAATVEELKEYFREQYEAGTPVTVFYILRNEKTEFISGNNITLEEGTNIISNSYEYNMDVSYYKTKGNNIPTEDDGSIDIDSLKKDFVAKESNTDPENEWWDDFKNFMGRNPEISPVDEQMKSPLVSAGMVTAFADRWKTGQQGMSTKGTLSDSTFVQGGHVFEGWDTEKEWRFTVLIGKFLKGRCHIFSFKPNESGVEEFGIVTVGGDHEYDGMDFAQKYAQMWGNIIASAFSGPSNYGSQKYYGGISGTDKTKPSGAHLEITADFHSTAPKQARFNDCENGLVIPVLSSDPTVLNNGTIWYNSTDNKFKAVSNGEIIILNQIS